MEIRLVVVEDSEVARIGIQESLSRHTTIRTVAEYACINELFAHLHKLQAQVVLLSDSAGLKNVVTALHQLAKHYPSVKSLVMAAAWSNDKIEELAELGVFGFLCRSDKLTEILPTAIHYVAHGDPYISPVTARTLLALNNIPNRNPLNKRQMQVLRLMARSFTPQEIALQMKTSASSIYAMQYRIRIALGVRTTAQILVEAIKRGWLEIEA